MRKGCSVRQRYPAAEQITVTRVTDESRQSSTRRGTPCSGSVAACLHRGQTLPASGPLLLGSLSDAAPDGSKDRLPTIATGLTILDATDAN
jgi:hypothetical protein